MSGTLVLGLLLGTHAGGLADPVRYVFTLIADTSDSYKVLGPFLSMNDSGIVAFKADLRTGGGGIFRGAGGPVTTFGNAASSPAEFGGTSTNAMGTVAFTGAGTGVFAGSGGPITTIALGRFLSFPSINDAGAVAFGTGNGIFVGSGGPLTTIAVTGPQISGAGDPAINARGTVVFVAGVPGRGQVILAGNGGPHTVIADTSGPFDGFSVFPVINDGGTVAFEAILDTGVRGIFATAGGSFSTLADTSGPYSRIDFFSINDRAGVAFHALLDAGGAGIFTGPDPLANKVAAVGDSLFGSAVTAVSFYREGFNDSGQVAFHATLADGRQAVVRADPLATVIQRLIAQIKGIASLNEGVTSSLISKIEAAERSIARGNDESASHQLNAFIQEVQGLERAGRLGAATAGSLIAEARTIIDALS